MPRRTVLSQSRYQVTIRYATAASGLGRILIATTDEESAVSLANNERCDFPPP